MRCPFPSGLPTAPLRLRSALGLLLLTGFALFLSAARIAAQEAAEAAAGPPLNIAILVSNRLDQCYDPGDVAAIQRFTLREEQRINARGGVAGRPLQIRVLDDSRNAAATTANIRSALSDPQLLAIIGLANSTRAQAAFKDTGNEIDAAGIPFISDLSVNSIFEKHPTVFTTRSSQDTERIPVTTEFIRVMGFERPAFIGLDGLLFATALGDGLKKSLTDKPLVADHRLKLVDDKLPDGDIQSAIADIAAKSPDMLILGMGSSRAGGMLQQMIAAGATPPLLLSGRIDALPPEIVRTYPNDIYQLAWDNLPEVSNHRLRKVIAASDDTEWVFEGRSQPEAPGWLKNECKERPEPPEGIHDPLSAANLRAITLGTQYADMVGLIASAAAVAGRGADIATYRARLVNELKSTYATGRGIFKGTFENWSFDPETRAASRTPFIVMLPRGLGRTQLAPVQFVRLKNGQLKLTNTLYLDVDLIRAHGIDDNEKTFNAEFYLSMRDRTNKATIEQIDFVNAALDPRTNGRQLTISTLHDGQPNAAYPENMKIYKVTGKFLFQPELSGYPFDTQRFSIDIQPKRSDAPFIVQPPPPPLRDKTVTTDGWDPKEQFVTHDEDFVPVVDPYTHTPSVVPFFKASYVWMMKRQTTDYFLRVVVPLAFILVVAYLSIFIPLSNFEAIVTIQVTALLSAVALYLSLPKLDSDDATLSDRIFLFDYLLVSLMIVISILLVNRHVDKRPWLRNTLTAVHIIAVPLMVAAMAVYLWRLTVVTG